MLQSNYNNKIASQEKKECIAKAHINKNHQLKTHKDSQK